MSGRRVQSDASRGLNIEQGWVSLDVERKPTKFKKCSKALQFWVGRFGQGYGKSHTRTYPLGIRICSTSSIEVWNFFLNFITCRIQLRRHKIFDMLSGVTWCTVSWRRWIVTYITRVIQWRGHKAFYMVLEVTQRIMSRGRWILARHRA